MALPYPEGIVYFKTEALKQFGYDATNESDFYGHFLVEYVWNQCIYSGSDLDSKKQDHDHSGPLHTGYGQWYNTRFGVWDTMHCNFGDNRDGTELKRRVISATNTNFNEIRDRDSGGPAKIRLCPIPMGPEKYLFLDLVVPIRAIYFPLASKASAVNQNLCTYLMMDFRLRKGVKMRSTTTGNVYDIPFDNSEGLGIKNGRSYQSLIINVPGVYALLSLPPQLRNMEKGLYMAKKVGDELVNLVGAGSFGTGTPPENTITLGFHREIDLAQVISDNFGVDISWTPYEYDVWVFDFLQNVVTLGLGYIPIAGPLISVAFSVGLTAITDPEFFEADNVLGLTTNVLNAVLASALGMRDNLPSSFKGSRIGVKR
ncbi:MAG: hypothetical protein Q9163_005913 [Psora crenata]